MKAIGRWPERLSKKTGLTVHRLAFEDHVASYKEELSKTKTNYYSTLIGSQQKHPRALFTTINRLLRPPQANPPTTDTVDLCSKFFNFFMAKINTIHQNLQAPAPSPLTGPQAQGSLPPHPQCSFSSFAPVNVSQVSGLVLKAKASTCLLDPMPTSLVKACLPALCPFITDIINSSLASGVVPPCFKTASISPILKKSGLDPDDLSNFRPISNLPFLSKVLEKAVAAQLHQHLSDHELYEPLQSAYRAHHSTETALIKITNDLLITADSGKISILILLDLTAAFDTVSHKILLKRLSHHLGITGTALTWFQSYLSSRYQFVTINGTSSPPSQ